MGRARSTIGPFSFRQSSRQSETDVVTLNESVEVTFYKMRMFREAFKNSKTSQFELKVLHASLSPKYNRDMVFKAGEGAGRSGSFFFFSHDSKYIIKTLTSEELKLLLKITPAFT